MNDGQSDGLEIGSGFRKSTRSGKHGGCVEVARPEADVFLVRDTKDQGIGPVLRFTQREWEAFILGVLGGQFTPQRISPEFSETLVELFDKPPSVTGDGSLGVGSEAVGQFTPLFDKPPTVTGDRHGSLGVGSEAVAGELPKLQR